MELHIYQINDEYLYLNIFVEWIGFFNIFYNISSGEVFDFSDNLKYTTQHYMYQNKIWFMKFNKLIAYFDLETGRLKNIYHNFHNKSHNWWISYHNSSIIVTSFDNKKTINLGAVKNKYVNTPFEDINKMQYFETNEDNTYFAFLDDIFYGEEGRLFANIRYGELKENALEDSKTFTIKYERLDAGCSTKANSSLVLKDNLIITTDGCPSILELIVFDIKNEVFIYRHQKTEYDYAKVYDDFTDVPEDHKNYEAIKWGQENKLIRGFRDHTFSPDKIITRVELVKMIMELLFSEQLKDYDYIKDELRGKGNIFPDCYQEEWYDVYLRLAKDKKIIQGYEDGTFKPYNNITLVKLPK